MLLVAMTMPFTAIQPEAYVIKVKSTREVAIRLLILKHSMISMADGDARLAIDAVEVSKTKGLRIKDIGNHFVNKNGPVRRFVIDRRYGASEFQKFVSEQMKIGAESGDTLVIFSIGHGFSSGGLDNLGARRGIMFALAEAAGENRQKTLWWQLSCHATAGLPKISELPENQQAVFSIATSSGSEESPAYEQGKIMEKVFVALAEGSSRLDPNQDKQITAKELSAFLGNRPIIFARSPDYVIFGNTGLDPNQLNKIAPGRPGAEFPDDLIPLPRANGLPVR